MEERIEQMEKQLELIGEALEKMVEHIRDMHAIVIKLSTIESERMKQEQVTGVQAVGDYDV